MVTDTTGMECRKPTRIRVVQTSRRNEDSHESR